MTTKLVALVLLCVMTCTYIPQEAKVTPLVSQTPPSIPRRF